VACAAVFKFVAPAIAAEGKDDDGAAQPTKHSRTLQAISDRSQPQLTFREIIHCFSRKSNTPA
jgi:hypothetical protein